jgi:hypothetical protein
MMATGDNVFAPHGIEAPKPGNRKSENPLKLSAVTFTVPRVVDRDRVDFEASLGADSFSYGVWGTASHCR